jgi:amino-acid N-acetyltransferase
MIRPAGFEDAEAIVGLIRRNQEQLLPRPLSDIMQNIDRFLVYTIEGKVVGSVSWQILPEIGSRRRPMVEVQSLAVEETHRRHGIGRSLVSAAIDRVRPLHPAQVVALTFTPEFFERLGFRRIAKEDLIPKIYAGCINCTKYDSPFTCPETAVALEMPVPPSTAAHA